MSISDKYERRLLQGAALETLREGLRQGSQCIVCRSWKGPCPHCQGLEPVVCATCGQAWTIRSVVGNRIGCFERKGARIGACPCCLGVRQMRPAGRADWLDRVSALACLCGNDLREFSRRLSECGLLRHGGRLVRPEGLARVA